MVAEILIVPGNSAEDLRPSAQYVGRGLSSVGVQVREQINLCPDTLKLQQAVAAGLGRSNIIVVLGGMGRASGFVSKNVISQGLGLPLEPNRESLAAIQAYCKKSGEPFDVDDLDLASLPRGARPFPAIHGKVPGCIISSSKQHIVLLPENAEEIPPMFNHYVVPALGGAESSTITRTLRTYGVGEAAVREMLADLAAAANPMVTVQKEGNEVLVRVTAHGSSGQQAAALCTPVLRTIVDRMGDSAYGLDVDSLQAAVVQKMTRKSLELGVAEAGLGGMLTRLIGETDGGAEILRYSVAADDDGAKVEKLDASPKLLRKRGSVSEYAAVAMAAGALGRTELGGIGLGVVANSSNPYDKKAPLGLVYVAVCDEDYVYVKKLVVGDGDASPDTIVDAAVSRALNMLRLFVDYLPEKHPGAIPLEAALRGKKTVTDGDSYEEEDEEADYEEEGSSGGKLKKLIFVVALLVFVGSAGYLGKTLWLDSFLAARQAEELQSMFQFGDEISLDEVPEDYPSNYLLKFAGLWTVNPDVVGFISIEDTTVQYPIVQEKKQDINDDDYYLRRDFWGNGSQHGIPFMDARVKVDVPSTNMVIYGHNMKDGQIFGELINYKDLAYYKEHPVINFDTVYREGEYKIISIFITNAYESQGRVFNYHDFIQSTSNESFQYYIDQVKVRSRINTTVDVQPGDELLTLSTCSYEFSDARLVIVARRVRSGESSEVNTADAAWNPNPLYPDVWYSVFPEDLEKKPSVEWSAIEATPLSAASPIPFNTLAATPSVAFSSVTLPGGHIKDTLLGGRSAMLARSSRGEDRVDTDRKGSSGAAVTPKTSSSKASGGGGTTGDVTVSINGVRQQIDLEDLIPMMVQNEVGAGFHAEAIKAQAVASYTYVCYELASGRTPSVYATATVSDKVAQAVDEVFGEMVTYNGKMAFTPYHATSAGATTNSASVWGGNYSYLVSVESPLETELSTYKRTVSMTVDEVEERIAENLHIEPSGDPATWFEILNYTDGGYNGDMTVCGETHSARTGSKLTGRLIRETVLNLRSACFTVEYDSASDKFLFTTYGFGHGVGMPQNGANLYAKEGWTYREILEYYYPGTEVR